MVSHHCGDDDDGFDDEELVECTECHEEVSEWDTERGVCQACLESNHIRQERTY